MRQLPAPLRPPPVQVHYMHKTLSRHHATGMKMVYEYQQDQGSKGIMDCVRECYAR